MISILTEELAGGALGGEIALISSLSFESRSLAVARALSGGLLHRWICLKNRDIEITVDDLQAEAIRIAHSASIAFDLVETERKHPLQLADVLAKLMGETRGSTLHWVIDVSTMTHETTLMMVAAIEELEPDWHDITYVYNAADQYSGNEVERNRRWVSRGIQGIRSVVGFSGLWAPAEPAVLVALPGFDLERVQRIVDEIEPERVIVGVARPSRESHAWMYERNLSVAAALVAMRGGSTFEYGAIDPIDAAAKVAAQLADVAQNVIIVPLNTKISTVAIGMLARLNPRWQVCYAPALVYNIHYSTASETFYVFGHREILDQIRSLSRQPELA